LIAAGWTSNLLDRFGVHELTAPGSVRGVVDFIPIGAQSRANVADVWILVGLVMLVSVLVRRMSTPGRVAVGSS
jgi:lipoprotein signal peptidase